ncbi:hypothetical protein AKJ16_DCAP23277 [Drosera capensis]
MLISMPSIVPQVCNLYEKMVYQDRKSFLISGDCETAYRMIEPEFFFSIAKQVLGERMAQVEQDGEEDESNGLTVAAGGGLWRLG